MGILVAVVGALTIGTLLGWFIHWMLHQRWAGRFNRSHMTHHVKLYPPKNLTSTEYRDSGDDDGIFVFVPIITVGVGLLDVVLYLCGVSLYALLLSVGVSAIVGYAHNWIHEAFHTESPWLSRLAWFRRLRALHFHHHRRMRYNLGILVYVWDKLFRTLREPTDK